MLKRNTEAVECYEKLVGMPFVDAPSKIGYAAAVIKAGEYERGVKILEDLTRSMPAHADAHNALGVVRYEKKKYKSAAASFKQAVEIDPDRALFRYNLAVAQLRNDNKLGAISQYKLLKESDPALARKAYRMIYADKLVFVKP